MKMFKRNKKPKHSNHLDIGEHKNVFHYDGYYHCPYCNQYWGALTTTDKEAPEECKHE